MSLSFPVAPMKATLGQLPTSDGDWAFEIKYDGYRTLVFVDDQSVRVQSSSSRDVTAGYPELGEISTGVHANRVVLDGEFVVLDDDGMPRFELVQRHERPGAFYIFDVLAIDDHDTTALPYEDRRRLLDQLVEPGDHWMVPVHRVGDGAALVEATASAGLEGVMAKRLGSLYLPGKRSPNWRKIKHRRRVDLTIGGFTPGAGNRSNTFGSLLLGRWHGDALVFAGAVGTGFDHTTLESLTTQLRDLEVAECPFSPPPPGSYRREAVWVQPTLVASVEIAEFTNDGFVRHASFRELTETHS